MPIYLIEIPHETGKLHLNYKSPRQNRIALFEFHKDIAQMY